MLAGGQEMTRVLDHLVGRQEELEALERALSEADQGGTAAVAVVGEPGIGKTRLLAELEVRADAGGRLVLAGSASELEGDLPFSVFVDALDEYVRGLDPSALERLGEDVRAELAHVFPSLSRLSSADRPAVQHERYRTHGAVRSLLEHLAATRTVVLVLDDLHWADGASVELLGALLRRPPAAPLLIALGLRPRGGSERLSATLERAHRGGELGRIELGALSREEAGELLGDTVDAERARALFEESGGNPFYLEQLARSASTAASSAPDRGEGGVPSAVAASLSEELARLSEPGRLVLEGAAVAGDPFEPELAAAAAGTSEAEATSALDELLRLDLVRPTDVPRRFRFRHPLVRRAVYESTAGGWRLGAHERCAAALAARGASAPARAHHVERSAREGDGAAVAVLREAGEASVTLAPLSAARWYADALRLLPQTAPREERVEILLARSGALTAAGRYAESHGALLDALAIAPDDTRLARACAGVEGLLGRQEQAGARLEAAIADLDERSPEAVALMIELVVNQFWRADSRAMQATAKRAAAAARAVGNPALSAGALAVLALADSLTGNGERASANLAESVAFFESLTDEELAPHLQAGAWLAGAELYLDRFAGADAHAARTLAVARAVGDGEFFLVLVQILGGAWRTLGKLADAADLLDGGVEAARLLDNTHALIWNLTGRSSIALPMGDLELALTAAEEAVALSQGADGSFHAAEAAVELAAALFESGHADKAVDLLLEAAGGEELVLIAGSARAHWLELLTRCNLALDRTEEAARAAAAAKTWAASIRLPLAAAWAGRATAAVEIATGDPELAARRAVASSLAAEEAGAPVEAALCRMVAGRALAAAGQHERATAELQRAAAELDRHGALRYRGHAEAELRRLGHSIHRRTRPGRPDTAGLAALTERELQLARLVVDRKTNPEIAAELFLSVKTVETHLRNIFRKVGVSSRVELARTVERER
jgi:ATP/maltotriose-dependent transcriptional regulator MalT